MLESVLAIPFWLEFAATITGGISGAMHGVRANYDVFGVVCLAVIDGLAGGILRDVLLQDYGIYAFQRPSLIVGCAVAGVVVFFFGKLVAYLDPVIDLLDNLSVAFWAVIGSGKGLEAGLGIIPAIILGTITAIGGGVLRDICMNREPEVFHASTLYGMAAFLGSLAYTLMAQVEFLEPYAAITCVILVLVLRYASLLFGWHTVPPRDYSDKVLSVLRKPVEWVNSFLRFVGLKREERAESTADIRKKIKGYERLRSIWRAPGKTSPLPPVSELESGLEEKLEDAEAEERAEEGAHAATMGQAGDAGAKIGAVASAGAAADSEGAHVAKATGEHAGGAHAAEAKGGAGRAEDGAADADPRSARAHAAAADARGAHATSANVSGDQCAPSAAAATPKDRALAVRAPAYMKVLAEASAAAQVQAPSVEREGCASAEKRAPSVGSPAAEGASGERLRVASRALQELQEPQAPQGQLTPQGSQGPQGPQAPQGSQGSRNSADREAAVLDDEASVEELLAQRVIDTSGLDVEVGVVGTGGAYYPAVVPGDTSQGGTGDKGVADKRGRRSRPRGQARQGRRHRSGR